MITHLNSLYWNFGIKKLVLVLDIAIKTRHTYKNKISEQNINILDAESEKTAIGIWSQTL